MVKAKDRLNISALSRVFGKTRNTIKKYLRMEGAPPVDRDGCYAYEELRSFMDLHKNGDRGLPSAGAKPYTATLNPQMQARANKLQVDTEIAQLALAQRKRDLISMSEVSETLIALRTELDRIMYEELELSLPAALEGKNLYQRKLLLQGVRDRIIGRFRSGSLNMEKGPGG